MLQAYDPTYIRNNLYPITDNLYDIGSSTKRVKNIYTSSNVYTRAVFVDTVDGSDTGTLSLSGAGTNASSRAAFIDLTGNESAATGTMTLQSGNVSGANIVISAVHSAGIVDVRAGGSARWSFLANGDLASNASNGGDLVINMVGMGIKIKEGSNATMGVATLVLGTITVSNTTVTANSRIFIQRAVGGGTIGQLSYTISPGTSFTINSIQPTDTSTVNWIMFEPA